MLNATVVIKNRGQFWVNELVSEKGFEARGTWNMLSEDLTYYL